MAEETNDVLTALKNSGMNIDGMKSDEGQEPIVDVTIAPPTIKDEVAKDFDETKYLDTLTGGKYKSKEELSRVFSEHEDIKNKYSDVEKKIKDYEEKWKEHEGYIKPANEFIKALNDAEEKGIDRNAFLKVNSVDIEKLSPQEAMRLRMQWENPELTEKEIERKIERKYRVSEYSDDVRDEEVLDLMTDLKLDSKEAKKFLSQYKVNIMQPDIEKIRMQQDRKREENSNAWKPVVDNLTNEFLELKATLDEEGKHVFNYKLSDKEKNELVTKANDLINSGLSHSPENVKALKDFLSNQVKAMKFDEMIKLTANHARGIKEEEWLKKVHQHSGDIKEDITPESIKNTSKDNLNKILTLGGYQ